MLSEDASQQGNSDEQENPVDQKVKLLIFILVFANDTIYMPGLPHQSIRFSSGKGSDKHSLSGSTRIV